VLVPGYGPLFGSDRPPEASSCKLSLPPWFGRLIGCGVQEIGSLCRLDQGRYVSAGTTMDCVRRMDQARKCAWGIRPHGRKGGKTVPPKDTGSAPLPLTISGSRNWDLDCGARMSPGTCMPPLFFEWGLDTEGRVFYRDFKMCQG